MEQHTNYAGGIRLVRSVAGINQTRLAEAAGIDRSYLNLIESGTRQPSLLTLQRIADALDFPLNLLVLIAQEPAEGTLLTDSQRVELSMALLKVLNMQPVTR